MANRSYLYSTNMPPEAPGWPDERCIASIGEHSFGIPLAFKLLLTGATRTCRSIIWERPDEIALIGNFEEGYANLREFMNLLSAPLAREPIEHTVAHLESGNRRQAYFVLECGEIFDMQGSDIATQNSALANEICNLRSAIPQLALDLNHKLTSLPPRPSILRRLFLSSPSESEAERKLPAPIHEAGLTSWAEFLYFDFAGDA